MEEGYIWWGGGWGGGVRVVWWDRGVGWIVRI